MEVKFLTVFSDPVGAGGVARTMLLNLRLGRASDRVLRSHVTRFQSRIQMDWVEKWCVFFSLAHRYSALRIMRPYPKDAAVDVFAGRLEARSFLTLDHKAQIAIVNDVCLYALHQHACKLADEGLKSDTDGRHISKVHELFRIGERRPSKQKPDRLPGSK